MLTITPLEPVDYLVIGHIARDIIPPDITPRDIIPNGTRLGGTVVYSGLTARALGLRVGIVTSCSADLPLDMLQDIPVVNYPSETSTTFENIYTPDGRIQKVYTVAPTLEFHMIPEIWRHTPIIHLGPVAQEVDARMVRYFPSSLIGLTPQGWMRGWDDQGHVYPTEWPEASFLLNQAGGVVISVEDVGGDETKIEEMAASCRILAVTEAENGVQLYWNGDIRHFRPPAVDIVDPTGCGDIFAAAFFMRLHITRDPWEAARFANQLAAFSVTRPGLEGIPTADEIYDTMLEVL